MHLIRFVWLLGFAGIYLYIYRRRKKEFPPVNTPIFGIVRTLHEIRNIFDNFIMGQLRDGFIERYLSGEDAPNVIDCGVNVGITVRWWFHLNRRTRVFGVDMMEEAQGFTVEALKSLGIGPGRYTPVTAALWSEGGKSFRAGVTDPLLGDTGFFRIHKDKGERSFVTSTLDSVLPPEDTGGIDLLKIDLEGSGAEALKGSAGILNRVKHVVIEIHSEGESEAAGKILAKGNFILRRTYGRHQWWQREPGKANDRVRI